jgi:hypothetical protein
VIKKVLGGTFLAAASSFLSEPTVAEELFVPHLTGVNAGSATGSILPEGWYFINTTTYLSGPSFSGTTATNVNVIAFVEIPEAVYSSPWTFLGGRYAAAIAEPWDLVALNGIGGATSGFDNAAAFSTVVTPFILSWDLPNNLHVVARTEVYIPDGAYRNPINHALGNINALDFFSFEPAVGLSWLSDGWNVSVKGYFDFNLQNQDNNYKSGDIFGTEESITKTMGKWKVGVTGFTETQISNDTGSDVALINGPQALIDGHRSNSYGGGPFVGYNFGPVNLEVWYDQTFATENNVGGGLLFTRLTIPLS